jgi:hypothetical protein
MKNFERFFLTLFLVLFISCSTLGVANYRVTIYDGTGYDVRLSEGSYIAEIRDSDIGMSIKYNGISFNRYSFLVIIANPTNKYLQVRTNNIILASSEKQYNCLSDSEVRNILPNYRFYEFYNMALKNNDIPPGNTYGGYVYFNSMPTGMYQLRIGINGKYYNINYSAN